MKSKYFYPIFKLKIKPWIKYWLIKKTEFKGKLSEILEGFSFNLQNTLRQKFVKFEILGNSIQDGEPSPENEVPILSSGDNRSITEKIVNRNWLIWELPYTVSTAGNIRLSNIPELEVGENYYFVGKCSDGKVLSSANCACVWHEGNTQLLNKTPNTTFTGIDISSATGFYIYVTSAIAGKTISEFMLVKGTYDSSNVPDYVPHEDQDYSIFVQQPMRSIGDVRDCFVKKSDGWYERHYIKEYEANNDLTLNGETDTSIQLLTPVLDVIANSSSTATEVAICNIMQNRVINNTGLNGVTGTKKIRINISKDFVADSQNANAYLKQKGMKIHYISENPIDLPCNPEQIQQLENRPYTYEDQTNIYSEDEVVPYLQIQYWESE